MLDGLIFPIS